MNNVNSNSMVSRNFVQDFKEWEASGLFGSLVLLFIILSFTAPNFLTTGNLLNVLQQAAFFGMIAFAMTLVIVAGEIDVSVGSSVALSSALLGVLVVNLSVPFWVGCVGVMMYSITVGMFAGWIRARFEVPSFISTLALYLSLKGFALLITETFAIPIDSKEFFYWKSGKLFGLPIAAIYMILIFVLVSLFSTKTVFGRSIYAVGGNAKAALLSGINVKRVRIFVFALTGAMAGFTGLLQSAQLSSGNPSIGLGLEFDAISAVIIGGTSLMGGKGSVFGTLLGVLLIAVLSNGMVLLGVNPYAQNVIRGGIVLGAVLISVIRRERMKGKI